MSMQMTEPADMIDQSQLRQWKETLEPVIANLGRIGGATEQEFLHIGAQLQDFQLRSSDVAGQANRLVEQVSGEGSAHVVGRLRQMMADMETYLSAVRQKSRKSCTTLEGILSLLEQVAQPLEGFRKMTKALRMLGISTKIESSRQGDAGAGFLTLAMDVEKLSHLVSEKSNSILDHSRQLSAMIGENLKNVKSSEASQDIELGQAMAGTAKSLENLLGANERCQQVGSLVATTSEEVAASISNVVSSMQAHDITRQQIEHVVEALTLLDGRLGDVFGTEGASRMAAEIGDVCELQAAQLRHASGSFTGALEEIITSLRALANQQITLAEETMRSSGAADPGAGGSFIDDIRRRLETVTAVLVRCTEADREMARITMRVADTIGEISGFVTDIEEIGSEIDLIALNSQVKAAHTGREGAALGVLAEAIKRLSVDALAQTESVSDTLSRIKADTAHFLEGGENEGGGEEGTVEAMGAELGEVLGSLAVMNDELARSLSALVDTVQSLSTDIERVTGGVTVQEQVRAMADQSVSTLGALVREARRIEPASAEFKNNLRHIEERYTMESERHIHEALMRRRGGAVQPARTAERRPASRPGSDFGDNVDLF